MSDFSRPADNILAEVQAFPAHVVGTLIPHEADIPMHYWVSDYPYAMLVKRWFFAGLGIGTRFFPSDGVNPEKALTHIMTVMRSYEPSQEHKEAAVALLLSKWFRVIYTPENDILWRYSATERRPATQDEQAELKATE